MNDRTAMLIAAKLARYSFHADDGWVNWGYLTPPEKKAFDDSEQKYEDYKRWADAILDVRMRLPQ